MAFNEILEIVNNLDTSETGGSHNKKGIDFQQYWAVSHMFTLTDENSEDFLVLFEAIQDISVFDSPTTPTHIKIYQIKKKDRNEWTWKNLTGLNNIPKKTSSKTKPQPFDEALNSTLGKLYASIKNIKQTNASGYFISNAGCDLKLKCGGNAATSVSCSLDTIDIEYLKLLVKGFKTVHEEDKPDPVLSNLHIQKTSISVDDPRTHLIGEVAQFLNKRSPEHANQAVSLVDALIAKISPLGRQTDKCHTTQELFKRQGFTKASFDNALSTVAATPNLLDHLEDWLIDLKQQGLSAIQITQIRAAANKIYQDQVLGTKPEDIELLENACEDWLETNTLTSELRISFEQAYNDLKGNFLSIREPMFYAVLAIKAIKQCVSQT